MPIPSEGSKVCSKCGGDPKPVTDFYIHSSKKRRMSVCRQCTIVANNKSSRKPERKTRDNAARRGKNARLRVATFAAYGGKCNCCGEENQLFLSVDHVENNGADWRRDTFGSRWAAGVRTYWWLAKNGFPDGFQLLCMNCNWGKRMNGGTCPHRSTCNDYPEMGVGPSGPKRSAPDPNQEKDIVCSSDESTSSLIH